LLDVVGAPRDASAPPGSDRPGYCAACFTGRYPISFQSEASAKLIRLRRSQEV
jgi:hypothetical protein